MTQSTKNYARKTEKDYNFATSIFQRLVILFLFIPFFTIMYKLKVNGRENIPKEKTMLIAANHLSFLDPPLIATAVNTPMAFMAKKELFEVPVLRFVIDKLGAFAVNREKLESATIKTAKVVLANVNWTMGLFPQGGRRRDGKLNQIHKGFITFAKLTKTDILPIGIIGADKTARLPFEGNVTINIGTIIPYNLDENEIMKQWKEQICNLANLEDNSVECEK